MMLFLSLIHISSQMIEEFRVMLRKTQEQQNEEFNRQSDEVKAFV